MEQLLNFNGVNAVSGEYLLPAIEPELFSRVIEGVSLDQKELEELKNWYFSKTRPNMGLKEGDPRCLDQAGWGAIFSSTCDPAVILALGELLDWREEQAASKNPLFFRIFRDEDGYQPGESKLGWLARHGMGPGPAEPERVPYYLLIVGDPQTIPYRFQTQLDIQYAVGRIYFYTADEYALYAHSVVEAEKRQLVRQRKIAFFGVSNPDDPATQLSAAELVQPLAEITENKHPDWLVQAIPPEQAGKAALAGLLGGKETPALLFSACHGLGFPNSHPLQLTRQGALLTREWPGPKAHSGLIPEDFYFSAGDVSDQARLSGLIAFFFACYAAGTPLLDEFTQAAFKDSRAQIAPKPFLAALPQRLLSHPRGSALAVVGHVDRAWGYSFYWGNAKRQLAVFESAINMLLQGFPIGAAMDPFNLRYAELSATLNDFLEDISFGKKYEPRELAGLWTANNDARNYVILGDPAARLMAGTSGTTSLNQAEMEVNLPTLDLSPAKTNQDVEKTLVIENGAAILPSASSGRLYSAATDSSYELPEQATIIIGRLHPASGSFPDIDLSSQGQPGDSVSRRHAQLSRIDNQVFIEDLRSSNATYLNGSKLDPGQRYLLKHGDELRLGRVTLNFLNI